MGGCPLNRFSISAVGSLAAASLSGLLGMPAAAAGVPCACEETATDGCSSAGPVQHHHHHYWWPCKGRKVEHEYEATFYAREAPRALVLSTVPAVLLAETALPVRSPRVELDVDVRRADREVRVLEVVRRGADEDRDCRSARDRDREPDRDVCRVRDVRRDAEKCRDRSSGSAPDAEPPAAPPSVPCDAFSGATGAAVEPMTATASANTEELERLRREVAELKALADELRRIRAASAEQVK